MCSDDRFTKDSMVFNKPEQKKESQDWLLLEDVLKQAVRDGNESTILFLIKLLPEQVREKYRKIWIDTKKEAS